MEWLNTLIAVIALVLGGYNSYRILKLDKKRLDLEVLRLQTEFGTLEDIDAEIRSIEHAHNQEISEIHKKWSDEQNKQAASLAHRGVSQSSAADNMIKQVKEGRKKDLDTEQREYNLKLQRLKSKRKLIKEKLDGLK